MNTFGKVELSSQKTTEIFIAAKLLAEGGDAYAAGDYELSLNKNLTALAKYRQLGELDGILSCLTNIGNIHQAQGHFDLAVHSYEEALELSAGSAELLESSTLATCMVNLGSLRGAAGDLAGALDLFQRSLDINIRRNDKMGEMRCLTNLGLAYQKRNDFDLALGVFQRALTLATPVHNTEVQMTCTYQLGLLYEATADFSCARAEYIEALSFARSLDDLRTAMCLVRLGAVHRSLGDFQAAMPLFLEAVEVNRRLARHPAVAASLVQVAAIHEASNDFSAAIRSYTEAIEALGGPDGPDALGILAALSRCMQRADPSSYSEMLFQTGLSAHTKGDSRGAIKLYEKSLRIREELGQLGPAAICYLAIATCYRDLNDRANALPALNQALTAYRKASAEGGPTQGLAACLYEIGLFHNHDGNLREALSYYSEAAEINRKLNDVEKLSTCLLATGHCFRYQGDLQPALKYFREALEVTRGLNNSEALAMCLFAVGDTYRVLRDYPNAREFLQKALDLNRSVNAPARVVHQLTMLGGLNQEEGDRRSARACYIEALNLARQLSDTTQIAGILASLGQLCQIDGEEGRRAGLAYFKESLAASESIKGTSESELTNIISCSISIADMLEAEQDRDDALSYYERALRLLPMSKLPTRIVQGFRLRCQLGIGGLYERQGRILEALEFYRQATEIARDIGDLMMTAMLTGLRGMAFLAGGDRVAARRDLVQAINDVEQLRLDVKADRDQQIYILGQFSEIYRSMIEGILWPAREARAAFEYLETSKGRTLTRLLDSFDRQPSALVPPELAQEYVELSRHRRELEMWPDDKRGNDSISAERDDVTLRFSRLHKQIVCHDPDFDLGLRAQLGRFDELQSVLRANDTAVIELFQGEIKNLAFVITMDGGIAGVETKDYSAERLFQMASEWVRTYTALLRHEIDEDAWHDTIDRSMADLYSDFWPAIRAVIPSSITKIVFVPHRLFHLFPLHAMFTVDARGKRYLLEEYRQISYAPSAGVFARCEMRRRPAATTFVAVDNPTADLRFASKEVDDVARLFDARTILGPRWQKGATGEACLRETRNANVVLWTGHSVGGAPERAIVRLAGKDQLTLRQLLKGLDLPVCSLWDFDTCETAFHLPDSSDEWVTLASAPLCAGARTVWSTLWAVDDFATAKLKQRAFQNFIRECMGPAEALNEAQRWLLRGPSLPQAEDESGWVPQIEQPPPHTKYRHPMYWAAFISSGGV